MGRQTRRLAKLPELDAVEEPEIFAGLMRWDRSIKWWRQKLSANTVQDVRWSIDMDEFCEKARVMIISGGHGHVFCTCFNFFF